MSVSRRPRVSCYSLGCKVNQYEMRDAAAELVRRGYELVEFGAPVDVCVVNTCTVTEHADAKSRNILRRASRAGDDPIVVATGCYATVDPDAVSAVSEQVALVPNEQKPRLADVVDDLVRQSGRLLLPLGEDHGAEAASGALMSLGGPLNRTRAVLKIQDGCDHFCSFCIIPFARGRLRSRPAAEVLAEARRLAGEGFHELVLTGVCIGDYGDEKGQPGSVRDPLALLLEELARIPGIERLRLSSVDPADVTEDLIEAVAEIPQVCRHLHLSMQAGNDDVLQRMRRRYTAAQFEALTDTLLERIPGVGLTADVIVGFPGESEAQFHDTVGVCRRARFSKIHAFPYSARPQTPAAQWTDDVPHAEKKRRVAELDRLSQELGAQFALRRLGEEVEVLVERRDRKSGLMTGLTDNYLRVDFAGADDLRGELVTVRLESAGANRGVGVLASA